MKNKTALRNQLKVTEAHRKGYVEKKTGKSSSQSSREKGRCKKGDSVPSKKGPQMTYHTPNPQNRSW